LCVQFRVAVALLRVDSIYEVIYDLTRKRGRTCVNTKVATKDLLDNTIASVIRHFIRRRLRLMFVEAAKRPSAAWTHSIDTYDPMAVQTVVVQIKNSPERTNHA